jgi:O-antigen/teichoic acid export membrane protein
MGLQKQLLLSFINVLCGTLRSVGALAILVFVSSTIQAFLLWQGVVALLQLVLMAITLKISLPDAPEKGRFQKDVLRRVWRFAAGMTGITVVALVLTQTDKIILSRMLDLEDFGYYTLAITISGMTTGIIVSSINHAAFPQFSRLVSFGDEVGLSEFYHRSCQIMSVLLFPLMVVFALFSYDILLIWIKKPEIAANTYLLLSLIAVGNGLNGSVWLPNTLQLAHGWTKPSFYLNFVSIFFLIPLIIFGVYQYGAVGAAAAWVILNASYFFILVQLTHWRTLKGEQWKWYLEDIALPFFAAFLTAGAGKLLFPSGGTRIETVIGLSVVSIATLLATVFSTKATRNYLKLIKNHFSSAVKTAFL